VGNRVEVTVDGQTDVFEAAVLAVPAPRLVRMLEPPAELASWLNEVRMLPTTTLALLVEGRLDADFFGLSFPRGTPPGDVLVALCVESRKTVGLVQAGREAVVAFPAPLLARELSNAEPSVVVERLMPAIDMVFPGIRSRVIRARVHRFNEGYTVFWPGYLEHLLRFDGDWLPPSLVLAGDYLVAPTVEGAVISGRRAASLLQRRAMQANRG
jgi:oxygen-dependent protoporphyrinogen oxidase